jgi:hypothetical protein
VRGDLALVLKLLETARAAEVVAAEEAMFKELGYGINNYLASLGSQDRASLQEVLEKKGLATVSAPALDACLKEQILVKEFERATIFPHRHIPTSIREKLELLGKYLDSVAGGLQSYPQTIERLRSPTVSPEGGIRCWLDESISRGVWSDFGTAPSPQEIIDRATQCTHEAKRIVLQFQQHPETMTSKTIHELISNLDVANRITFDYAMDLFEGAKLTFAETKPIGLLERIFKVKPREACNSALSALFERLFLIKRATGVGAFVEHMRGSLGALSR